ncbi:hypothetical protein [Paraburkholderia solisilvae]|uniref:Uncharacterized protein n=1 Tax=Paraburkholderia solisilvae TaxID=624376 RepID=A0A6J5D9Y3_9BURK|nr:hypothetical protein [Paraburkholderia solisilvae]CAB3750171.1 hypothetical protein LMG29739_00968 [Paraburkholderia solisilvae]
MQARKSFTLLAVPFMLVVHGLACAADSTPSLPSATQQVAADTAGRPTANLSPDIGAMPAGAVSSTQAAQATHTTQAAVPQASPAAAAQDDGFGVAMTAGQLDEHRGGDALIGQNDLTGTVASNTANRVVTGSNSISQGSFANSSGLPTVIQNSGANVLIQNATVLNVRFGE